MTKKTCLYFVLSADEGMLDDLNTRYGLKAQCGELIWRFVQSKWVIEALVRLLLNPLPSL